MVEETSIFSNELCKGTGKNQTIRNIRVGKLRIEEKCIKSFCFKMIIILCFVPLKSKTSGYNLYGGFLIDRHEYKCFICIFRLVFLLTIFDYCNKLTC